MNSTPNDRAEMPPSSSAPLHEHETLPSVAALDEQRPVEAFDRPEIDAMPALTGPLHRDDGPPKLFVDPYEVFIDPTLAPQYFAVHPFTPTPIQEPAVHPSRSVSETPKSPDGNSSQISAPVTDSSPHLRATSENVSEPKLTQVDQNYAEVTSPRIANLAGTFTDTSQDDSAPQNTPAADLRGESRLSLESVEEAEPSMHSEAPGNFQGPSYSTTTATTLPSASATPNHPTTIPPPRPTTPSHASSTVGSSVPTSSPTTATPATNKRWTIEENNALIESVRYVVSHGGHDEKVWDMWELIAERLEDIHGYKRTHKACKIWWGRKLRSVSGFDERKTPNPNRMTTSAQN
ncbi:uncharacterized protein BKA78DRAFT_363477 [Phyllosticta capitalensis]|uniref:uncharacterized protein n=1 Tax=Phyllosticta capitalensis TaxID=121624 RepID=UPI0031327E2F